MKINDKIFAARSELQDSIPLYTYLVKGSSDHMVGTSN